MAVFCIHMDKTRGKIFPMEFVKSQICIRNTAGNSAIQNKKTLFTAHQKAW